MEISLIVGLGNPGKEYERTRHNIGFMAIDRLAQSWGIKLTAEKRFQGLVGEGRAFSGKIRLLKPTTFMNTSGQSVRSLIDWYKCDPASVLVIYDDMDLPLGKIRLRQSGSAGGHNGMKSIIAHLGTQDFPRLRLGIGRGKSEHAPSTISHVLGGFLPEETLILPELFRLTESVVTGISKDGIEKTMSLFNSTSVSSTP
jgi:peptidyl-tRNA hydrolase, PTH1 family